VSAVAEPIQQDENNRKHAERLNARTAARKPPSAVFRRH
jgi:hypothetical protein